MDFSTKIKTCSSISIPESAKFIPFQLPHYRHCHYWNSRHCFLACQLLYLRHQLLLNWHRIDLLHRLSPSSTRHLPSPLASYSPTIETRGLDETVIRSIPLLQYKRPMAKEETTSDCAVCLIEFEEDETVRVIPNCSHLFHIDCIDIWLQSNPNCPLCRTVISSSVLFHPFALPSSSPEDSFSDEDESDFIVIELGGFRNDPSGQFSQERPNSRELPARKLEHLKKRRKLQKVTSFGDEWIDTKEKDEQFCIQPIRRSVSMDSSVQAALQQNRHGSAASPSGDGCNGKGRSLFSFGNGRSCRNAVQVQPVRFEEN